MYKTWAKDPAEIVRPSVEGTRQVLGAATGGILDQIESEERFAWSL